MTRIIIADDHQMLINGLRLILAVRPDIEVTASVHNGFELLKALAVAPCDLVLLDINMPVLNGYQVIGQLKKDFPTVKVVVLSMLGDQTTVWGMFDAGADGYLLKNTDDYMLFAAIDAVMKGQQSVSDELVEVFKNYLLSKKSGEKEHVSPILSVREIEIVKLIVAGSTNIQIADQLFLSVRTVDTHRKNIFYKLKLNNTASLVRYAFEHRFFIGLD